MPNYCNNSLTLNEDSNDSILDVLKEYFNEGNQLDFELIRPIPDELRNTTAPTPKDADPAHSKELVSKYGADNWWDWCVMNWGTKWNCEVYDADKDHINFTTAWSPPIGIVKTLSILTGREFRLTYIEEGCDFCGEYFSFPNWLENHDHEYAPIKDAPDALKEELCGESWWADNEEDEDEN